MEGKPAGVSASQLLNLLEQQGRRCALTGDELTPDNVAVDHIFPIKRGGEHAICNFQLVTKDANRAKNTQTQSEFISLCKKVVEKHGS